MSGQSALIISGYSVKSTLLASHFEVLLASTTKFELISRGNDCMRASCNLIQKGA